MNVVQTISGPIGANSAPELSTRRLQSLDAFRGAVIVLMFLVNVAGHDQAFPSWMPHRGWNNGKMGNGLADYVFPWFLFIVGVAIPFSMNSGRGRGLTACKRVWSAGRRGLIIYLLGTAMWCATIGYKPSDPAAFWHGPITWRVFLHWDILPLIGLGYFLSVCLYVAPKGRSVRIGFIVAVLAAKFALLKLVDYPGEGRVIWEETRCAQSWIREQLGWLGTALTQGLPAAACVTLGSLAGDWLSKEQVSGTRRAVLLAVLGLGGYVLAVGAHISGLMPASKDFFTSSYVLGTAGAACMVLAGMYWVVDVRRLCSLTFLRVYGMNALAAYVGAELIWKVAMVRWEVANPPSFGGSSVMITAFKAYLQSVLGNAPGAWALVILYILFYWTVCWMLYRKRIFIKV